MFRRAIDAHIEWTGLAKRRCYKESMKNDIRSQATLSDAELLREVKQLTACERQATARLVAALGELDARRLYLAEGCSSLFTYCTQVLHLSEHAAYGRIEAARAARKWPDIVDLLADGSLHLTAIGLLAPHLTDDGDRNSSRPRRQEERAALRADRRRAGAADSGAIDNPKAAGAKAFRSQDHHSNAADSATLRCDFTRYVPHLCSPRTAGGRGAEMG